MKNSSKKSIRNALAIVLCVITVILSLCSCSSDKTPESNTSENGNSAVETVGNGKKLSINDYVTVNFKSMSSEIETLYSGYVYPELEVDYEKLADDIGKKGAKNYYKVICDHDNESAEYYADMFDGTIADTIFDFELKENNRNLYNGDTVTVVLDAGLSDTLEETVSALGISIEKEINVTVSGLTEAKKINLMGDPEKYITYKGANGNNKVNFDYSSAEEKTDLGEGFFLKPIMNGFEVIHENESIGTYAYYFVSTDENGKVESYTSIYDVKEGDVLSIKIDSGSSLFFNLIKLGYVPAENNREITVPDLGEYITSKEQLSSEEIETIRQALFTKLSEKYSNVEIASAHFATIQPGEECKPEEKAEIHFVCGKVLILSKSFSCYRVNGIAKNKAGEIKYEIVSSDYGYAGSAAEIESSLDASYTYEKLF